MRRSGFEPEPGVLNEIVLTLGSTFRTLVICGVKTIFFVGVSNIKPLLTLSQAKLFGSGAGARFSILWKLLSEATCLRQH